MTCGERAAVTVADVLRDHVAGLCLDHEQAKVVAHILACRTGRLGGHVAVCDRCGHSHFAYHSCMRPTGGVSFPPEAGFTPAREPRRRGRRRGSEKQ